MHGYNDRITKLFQDGLYSSTGPCKYVHDNITHRQSNKSTNQTHQSLRFIARRSNTAQHGRSWSVRPDRPRPTELLPPRSNGKPEAATAVYKLLMMGKRIPETCWAVFERRAINLRDFCVWLVDLFECIMMHGLTNPKLTVSVTALRIFNANLYDTILRSVRTS